jgi:hypothetical protein
MTRSSRISSEIEIAVLDLASEHPKLGRVRAAAELCRRGLKVSASMVRAIWARHGLETASKRINASVGLEADNQSVAYSIARPESAPGRDYMSDAFVFSVMALTMLGTEAVHASHDPQGSDEQGSAHFVQEVAETIAAGDASPVESGHDAADLSMDFLL